jgi:hypothetical protein
MGAARRGSCRCGAPSCRSRAGRPSSSSRRPPSPASRSWPRSVRPQAWRRTSLPTPESPSWGSAGAKALTRMWARNGWRPQPKSKSFLQT